MRRTIQGRRFDTQVSELIGSHHASEWSASLYRTPQSHRYFLAGRGGMMSRWRDSEGIFELSEREARAWIKEYLNGRKVT